MKLNCILLAGTHGSRKFMVNGREEYKQYLPLGKKVLIEYVIDALLKAQHIKNVYIVGDAQRLNYLCSKKYSTVLKKRLFVVKQYTTVVENITLPFLHNILPHEGYSEFKGTIDNPYDLEQYRLQNPKAENETVLLAFSDMPFLSSRDVDYFIETSKLDYDYVYGLSTQKAINALLKKLHVSIDIHRLKLGTFPIYREAIRLNNLQLLKPLRINPEIYKFALAVYTNRALLTSTGKEHAPAWFNILRALLHYTLGKGYRYKVTKGIFQTMMYGMLVYLAHAHRTNRLGKTMRWFLKPRIFEKICFNLSGGYTRATVNISHIVSSLVDIDNEEMYTFLTDHNCALFNQISKYTYK